MSPSLLAGPARRVVTGTLRSLILVVVLAVGFAEIISQVDALDIHWKKSNASDFLRWLLYVGVAGGLLKLVLGNRAVPALSCLIILYLCGGVGWSQAFSVALFAASAYCAGRLLAHACLGLDRAAISFLESLFLGLGCYVFLFGILLHFPVNFRGYYLALLVAPLLAVFALRIGPTASGAIAAALPAGTLAGIRYPSYLLAAAVIGGVTRYCFLPTVTYDDNAVHLRLWTALENQHHYDFDVSAQVWGAAPFAVDLLHAIVSLIAQSDAKSALNLGFAGLLIHLTWRLTRSVHRDPRIRLLLAVLFASTPLYAYQLTTLQTELFLAVLATGGAVLITDRASNPDQIAALLMIAALGCATKLPGAVLGAGLVLGYGASRIKQWNLTLANVRQRSLGLLVVAVVATVAALHSYGISWLRTGNPLFPLYNGLFKSPLFPPYNFVDTRYMLGATPARYWDVFFNTRRYLESGDFVAGFHYLLLLPVSVGVLLLTRRRSRASFLLVPLLLFGLVMFTALQYWRYLFPVMPLASVMAGVLFRVQPETMYRGVNTGVAMIACAAVAVANLFFLPGVVWYLDVSPQRVYDVPGKRRFLEERVPEQVLNERLNQLAPGARVLYDPDRPFGANLAATPVYTNWYAPAYQAKVAAIDHADALASFLHDENIRFVYWDMSLPAEGDDRHRRLLREYLVRYGDPLFRAGSTVAYRLSDHEHHYRETLRMADFRRDLQPPAPNPALMDDGALQTNEVPLNVRRFSVDGAGAARYTAQLDCPVREAFFIAQINWDVGLPYYRLVRCSSESVQFEEVIPVPVGARSGDIYLTSRQGAVTVRMVQVALNP